MQDFYVKEEDIRELIGVKISLSKKNYLSYMGHGFILEAGRGNKWMIQSDGINKELISLFTRNNIIGESESDSSSEESSED